MCELIDCQWVVTQFELRIKKLDVCLYFSLGATLITVQQYYWISQTWFTISMERVFEQLCIAIMHLSVWYSVDFLLESCSRGSCIFLQVWTSLRVHKTTTESLEGLAGVTYNIHLHLILALFYRLWQILWYLGTKWSPYLCNILQCSEVP